jgi:hypothetical protein
MSAPLQAGDILYYPPFNEHYMLLECEMACDGDDIERPAWTMLCLESNKETWYWEMCLEDEEMYRRIA